MKDHHTAIRWHEKLEQLWPRRMRARHQGSSNRVPSIKIRPATGEHSRVSQLSQSLWNGEAHTADGPMLLRSSQSHKLLVSTLSTRLDKML